MTVIGSLRVCEARHRDRPQILARWIESDCISNLYCSLVYRRRGYKATPRQVLEQYEKIRSICGGAHGADLLVLLEYLCGRGFVPSSAIHLRAVEIGDRVGLNPSVSICGRSRSRASHTRRLPITVTVPGRGAQIGIPLTGSTRGTGALTCNSLMLRGAAPKVAQPHCHRPLNGSRSDSNDHTDRDAQTLTFRLRTRLRNSIKSGRYPKGVRPSSERDLAVEFKVSRTTRPLDLVGLPRDQRRKARARSTRSKPGGLFMVVLCRVCFLGGCNAGVRHLRRSIKSGRMAADLPVDDGLDPVVDSVVFRMLRHRPSLPTQVRQKLRIAHLRLNVSK